MGHPRALLYALPFALLACTEKLVPLEEITSTTIGANGGKALSAAGELSLDFQAGTLSEGTVIKIRTNRDYSGPRLQSVQGFAVYELSADPPVTTFSKPVTIAIKVQPIGSGGDYVVANFDGPQPVRLPSTYADRVARAELVHFSSYGAWTGTSTPSACPESAPNGSQSCSQEGLRCEYGQECCCGQCYPSTVWQCSGGSWAGHATDACLGAAFTCPDSGVPQDGGGPNRCPSIEFCLSSCGSDALFEATCVDEHFECPPPAILASRQDELCVGQLGGLCSTTSTPACSAGLACANNNRCYPVCTRTQTSSPAADHFGRCRGTTGNPLGCCTADVIDGLCGIQLAAFEICPQGSVLATTCTSSPSQPCQ